MKYRSLLLHTYWGISLCLLSSNASLNFCLNLFQKNGNLSFPLPFFYCLLRGPVGEVWSCPLFSTARSLLHPALHSRPADGQRRPGSASAAARWGPQVNPHLAPCMGRTRGPTPSLRRARACPRAHLPRRLCPIRSRRLAHVGAHAESQHPTSPAPPPLTLARAVATILLRRHLPINKEPPQSSSTR
jgi:hypothetical protein